MEVKMKTKMKKMCQLQTLNLNLLLLGGEQSQRRKPQRESRKKM